MTAHAPRTTSTATEVLALALGSMLEAGRRPPCSTDPELWTSDHRADLEQAATACAGCALLEPCRAAGQAEDHHVWGGTVRDHRWRDDTVLSVPAPEKTRRSNTFLIPKSGKTRTVPFLPPTHPPSPPVL